MSVLASPIPAGVEFSAVEGLQMPLRLAWVCLLFVGMDSGGINWKSVWLEPTHAGHSEGWRDEAVYRYGSERSGR